MVLEATALPTEPQPLPCSEFFVVGQILKGFDNIDRFSLKMGHSRPLFFNFGFLIQLTENKCSLLRLLMAGFEPGSSRAGRDHSSNCATTIAPSCNFYQDLFVQFSTSQLVLVQSIHLPSLTILPFISTPTGRSVDNPSGFVPVLASRSHHTFVLTCYFVSHYR